MRILLVEDDSGNRALLRMVLEDHGYGVEEAADGAEALRALDAGSFAVVITDVLMPKMDGYRLCYEIRHHPRFRHLPIIIYTATYTAPSDERLSMDLGADRFLRKPATAGELVWAVQEILAEAGRSAPTVRAGLDDLGAMQQYSQGLVDKLARKNQELEGQAKVVVELQLRQPATARDALRPPFVHQFVYLSVYTELWPFRWRQPVSAIPRGLKRRFQPRRGQLQPVSRHGLSDAGRGRYRGLSARRATLPRLGPEEAGMRRCRGWW